VKIETSVPRFEKMPPHTEDEILTALDEIIDPDLGKGLASAGLIKDLDLTEGVSLTLELTTPACPLKAHFQARIKEVLSERFDLPDDKIKIKVTSKVRSAVQPSLDGLKDVKNIILVASGKGGVGKSTVATNLALALARSEAKVGLLDADVYGPSIPTMLGIKGGLDIDRETELVEPISRLNIKTISIGLLTKPGQAVIWRGPMLHSWILTFLGEVDWGELAYLIIDLPPGTGDVQLSIAQTVGCNGAVVVTTPQQVAIDDVSRCLNMFGRIDIPVLGVIENMSGFVCPHCQETTDIFSRGGGEQLAGRAGVPFLGSIPLQMEVVESSEKGVPVVASDPDGTSSRAFIQAAEAVAHQVALNTQQGIVGRRLKPKPES
jgi:ATP-binding protein involved in chromosome partitioning